jgi:hypothetical protein
MAESLLAAEVPFSCLNGCVSNQKLNLRKLFPSREGQYGLSAGVMVPIPRLWSVSG